jgi:hypothetical protein
MVAPPALNKPIAGAAVEEALQHAMPVMLLWEMQDKTRLMRGVLLWEMSTNYKARLWVRKGSARTGSRHQEARRRHALVDRARSVLATNSLQCAWRH